MKKIIALSAVAVMSTSLFANADMQIQIDELKKQLEKLQTKQDRNTNKISKVNALAAKDNLKFDVDFRTSYDNIEYTTVSGKKYKNGNLYSMRLWLGMGYAPTDEMVFKGQLSYNKAFGASYGQRATGMGFDTFDWVLNENLTDDTLRVREAYWLWTPTTGDIGWTLSVGRRPATNGYLINLRDDDKAKSPMGHIINMEFDGASAGIKLDNYVPGMMFKLCAGRGLTNAASWGSEASGMANPMYPNAGSTPNYIPVDGSLDTTDLIGFIFKPYDDGQYAVETTYYRAYDVPGMNMTANQPMTPMGPNPAYNPMMPMANMETVGDMDGAAISLKVEGIGEEINDFLDETILFASYAWSKSSPNNTNTAMGPTGPVTGSMMGSKEKQTGKSYWVGTQMPNFMGGKFGLEYNHGDKYWRPFTYGEDTMIGSKMAVRGKAIEGYITQPIVDALSMQIRYTYLKYDYTGSDGFFGQGGAPMTMSEAKLVGVDAIEKATDLRIYLRYRY